MKSVIVTIMICLLPITSIAAENISLNVDGESYSCQKSSASVACRCVENRGQIDFRLNGKDIKAWYGNNSQNMIECAQYASSQSYCAGSQPASCSCVEDRSEIEFRLNGKEIKVWYGNNADNMIECVKHLGAQSFCK